MVYPLERSRMMKPQTGSTLAIYILHESEYSCLFQLIFEHFVKILPNDKCLWSPDYFTLKFISIPLFLEIIRQHFFLYCNIM